MITWQVSILAWKQMKAIACYYHGCTALREIFISFFFPAVTMTTCSVAKRGKVLPMPSRAWRRVHNMSFYLILIGPFSCARLLLLLYTQGSVLNPRFTEDKKNRQQFKFICFSLPWLFVIPLLSISQVSFRATPLWLTFSPCEPRRVSRSNAKSHLTPAKQKRGFPVIVRSVIGYKMLPYFLKLLESKVESLDNDVLQ